ncbi:MAG: hypothetical protein GX589_09780 [Deltaproteobacteria bacterium]|nr:hypothetical protein [Deltaproteobacteria bacterium]
MLIKRSLLLIALMAATVLALYAYNRSIRPLKSPMQVRYDEWLSNTEKILRYEGAELPEAIVSLVCKDTDPVLSWELNTSKDGANVLRLLRLISDANLFSAGASLFKKHSTGPITLSVTTPTDTFKANMRREDLLSSPAGAVFMKLVEVYATGSSG